MCFTGTRPSKQSRCDLLRSALADFKPVVNGLYAIHENIYLQKKSFIEEKKRKLAELKHAKEELRVERKLVSSCHRSQLSVIKSLFCHATNEISVNVL